MLQEQVIEESKRGLWNVGPECKDLGSFCPWYGFVSHAEIYYILLSSIIAYD